MGRVRVRAVTRAVEYTGAEGPAVRTAAGVVQIPGPQRAAFTADQRLRAAGAVGDPGGAIQAYREANPMKSLLMYAVIYIVVTAASIPGSRPTSATPRRSGNVTCSSSTCSQRRWPRFQPH